MRALEPAACTLASVDDGARSALESRRTIGQARLTAVIDGTTASATAFEASALATPGTTERAGRKDAGGGSNLPITTFYAEDATDNWEA